MYDLNHPKYRLRSDIRLHNNTYGVVQMTRPFGSSNGGTYFGIKQVFLKHISCGGIRMNKKAFSLAIILSMATTGAFASDVVSTSVNNGDKLTKLQKKLFN